MGRTGITKLDVEKAALQLQGRGKNPTVDSIRELLGTGSKSTIAQHLRGWKAETLGYQGNLPQDLLALVNGLWERLNDKADLRLEESERVFQQELQTLKEKQQVLQQDYVQLKIQLNHTEEDLSKEHSLKAALESQLQDIQNEYTKLMERYEANAQQMKEQKEENQQLHQLAKHIQANLEHYQQAMQQRQIEHELNMEKQQTYFQQTINSLQLDLKFYRNKAQEAEEQAHIFRLDLEKRQEQEHVLQEAYARQAKDHQEILHEFIRLKERNDQYQKAIETKTQALDEAQEKLQSIEKQAAVYFDQVQQLQKTCQQAEDRVETLRHEKLFLIQEKAQLEGYIQKLEKLSMMT